MLLTWVPSKKAMAGGYVPADYSRYDINVLDYLSPELAELIRTEAPAILESVAVAATRTMRHAFNNECASNWGAAKTPETDTPEIRAKHLDEWRVDWRNKFIAGELGLRQLSVVAPEDELTTEAKLIAFNVVKEYVLNKGGDFNYNVVNARSLAVKVGDSGRTVGDWIADLLDREKSPKRSAKIWADAQKVVDARLAAKASAAEVDDEDDELAAMFADDESDAETEPEGAAAE